MPARTPRPSSERDRQILQARQDGQTLAAIGAQWGLTRERVRQIVDRAQGATTEQVRAVSQQHEQARLEALGDRLHEALRTRGTATVAQLCADVGCSRPDLRQALRPADRRLVLAHATSGPRWSPEVVLAGLRALSDRVAQQQGVPGPVRVTRRQWDSWREPGVLPSAVAVVARWRTWGAACAAAGLPVADRTAPSGVPTRWSDQDLVIWVARFLLTTTGPATAAAYDVWCRRVPGAPGVQTVTGRLGGWNRAKTRATGR